MATDNKGVMIYLPKDLEEYITNFCTEHDITRKDKEGNSIPSLGTGVVTYLKRAILNQSSSHVLIQPTQPSINGLSKQEVLDLIDWYFTNKLPVDNSARTDTNETLNPQQEEDLPSGIDNAIHQALTSLEVPSREELNQLKQQIKQLHREIMVQI
jgi:hypothetical protein